MVQYGDAVLYVGDPCNGTALCKQIPPAIAALSKVLEDLDAQELARGDCLATFPR